MLLGERDRGKEICDVHGASAANASSQQTRVSLSFKTMDGIFCRCRHALRAHLGVPGKLSHGLARASQSEINFSNARSGALGKEVRRVWELNLSGVLEKLISRASLSEINFPNTPLRRVCDDLAGS